MNSSSYVEKWLNQAESVLSEDSQFESELETKKNFLEVLSSLETDEAISSFNSFSSPAKGQGKDSIVNNDHYTDVTTSALTSHFLHTANEILVQDKVINEDPEVVINSDKVFFRSYSGSYLQKIVNSVQAYASGSPFDTENCEFIVEKLTPGKLLKVGDSIYIKTSKSGLFLSGHDFKTEPQGFWIIDSTDTKASESYLRYSNPITLRYSFNDRYLGISGSDTSNVVLEVHPNTQKWSLIKSNSIATVFYPKAYTLTVPQVLKYPCPITYSSTLEMNHTYIFPTLKYRTEKGFKRLNNRFLQKE